MQEPKKVVHKSNHELQATQISIRGAVGIFHPENGTSYPSTEYPGLRNSTASPITVSHLGVATPALGTNESVMQIDSSKDKKPDRTRNG